MFSVTTTPPILLESPEAECHGLVCCQETSSKLPLHGYTGFRFSGLGLRGFTYHNMSIQ